MEKEQIIVIPVAKEDVSIEKRRIETGKLRIRKIVREREELVEVSVLEDEYEIRKVPVNRIVDRPESLRQEGDTTILPIHEEVVIVEKKLMLKEELHISRRQKESSRQIPVKLRSEEPLIERVEASRREEQPPDAVRDEYEDPQGIRANSQEPEERASLERSTTMARTLIGLYEKSADSNEVVRELVDMGISYSNINTVTSERVSEFKSYAEGVEPVDVPEHLGGISGVLSNIKDFFKSLAGKGVSEEEYNLYEEGIRRGAILVSAHVEEDQIDRVVEIMNRHNPIDIGEKSELWRREGWSGYVAGEQERYQAMETRIPVAEEEVHVGKKTVERGRVRLHVSVEERPVEEEVQLREEHLTVERRHMDMPVAGPTDDALFSQGTIELTETGEEVVVSKQARIVEEIIVRKEAEEHTEAVHEVERHARVQTERVGEEGRPALSGLEAERDYFRQHYEASLSRVGSTYEELEPAYQYGYLYGAGGNCISCDWGVSESGLRERWESEHRDEPWEGCKEAVRHGWSRACGCA